MAYKSTRQLMLESARDDMTKTVDEDMKRLSKQADAPNRIFAVTQEPMLHSTTCYFCGTDKEVQEIKYGNKYKTNVIEICPICRNWFGEFLTSGNESVVKTIEEE